MDQYDCSRDSTLVRSLSNILFILPSSVKCALNQYKNLFAYMGNCILACSNAAFGLSRKNLNGTDEPPKRIENGNPQRFVLRISDSKRDTLDTHENSPLSPQPTFPALPGVSTQSPQPEQLIQSKLHQKAIQPRQKTEEEETLNSGAHVERVATGLVENLISASYPEVPNYESQSDILNRNFETHRKQPANENLSSVLEGTSTKFPNKLAGQKQKSTNDEMTLPKGTHLYTDTSKLTILLENPVVQNLGDTGLQDEKDCSVCEYYSNNKLLDKNAKFGNGILGPDIVVNETMQDHYNDGSSFDPNDSSLSLKLNMNLKSIRTLSKGVRVGFMKNK